MPDIIGRIQEDVKNAMKARDEFRLGVLRMLSSKLKDAQIAQGRGEAPTTIIRLNPVQAKFVRLT